MNVRELKEKLAQYPDDMTIIYQCCSDYDILNADDIKVVKAVPKNHYYMRSHPTMSEENKALEQSFLCLPGN